MTDQTSTEVEPYDPNLPAVDEAVDAELIDEDPKPSDEDVIDAELEEPDKALPPGTDPVDQHGSRPGGGSRSSGGGGGGAGGGSTKKPRRRMFGGSRSSGGGFNISLFSLNFRLNFSPMSNNKMIDMKQSRRQGRPAPRRYAGGK